ncbi:MAG: hypothetical protein AAF193_07180 [Bacteroidota bacterium]
MSTRHNDLKKAVHSMLNDVVEQCFQRMIHHPEDASDLNGIIKDATDEINYQVLKLEANQSVNDPVKLDEIHRVVSKDTHKKSMELLRKLQHLQKSQKSA